MQLEDRFYTSTEVAEILGVSLRSVYRYLEEGKINAEIKTATGRHRFTRQNILDFLYPDGQPENVKSSSESMQKEPSVSNTQSVRTQEQVVTQQAQVTTTNTTEQTEAEPQTEEEEEIDWLSKFRAAAQKHREQIQQDSKEVEETTVEIEVEKEKAPVIESTPEPAVPVSSPVEAKEQTMDSLSSLTEPEPKPTPAPEAPKVVIQNEYYYTSGVGGLKELAQYINKAARKSNIPYAFTMNAGLSLHKLIRPFSTLHIYVKSDDRAFFEKTLELSPTDKSSAQLVIYIDRSGVLANTNEIHGLSVVANSQLKADLQAAGEDDLAKEIDDLA